MKQLLALGVLIVALAVPVSASAYLGDPGGGGNPICQDWNIGALYHSPGNGLTYRCTWGNPDYWSWAGY